MRVRCIRSGRAAAAVLGLAAGLSAARASVADRPPNVIFILADDLGYGDLGSYGQEKVRTPHLDRLAAGGMRFTSYYAGSTVCAPSRCALLTGLHMGHAQIRGNGDFPLRDEDVTVAEVLKAAGYATAAFGKWGLGREGTTGQPGRQGFDESFGYLDHGHAHRYTTDHLYRNGEKVPIDPAKYTPDLFTQAAIDWIRSKKGGPFFIYLAYTTPHAELRAPEDSLREYLGSFPEKPFSNPTADAHPSRGYRSQPAPKASFAAMVSRLDRDIGRLLDVLRESGIDGETAVFFSSDNGPHAEGGHDPAFFRSAGPLRGMKRDLYEGGIRVPLIVRWPGKVPAGSVNDDPFAHWDFLPTAAEMAGVRPPPDLDGTSMLCVLRGGAAAPRKPLYWEFFERGFDQALRDGRWKAVRRGGRPLELYDLERDPRETADLSRSRPDIANRMEGYLKAARIDSERWKPRPRRARV